MTSFLPPSVTVSPRMIAAEATSAARWEALDVDVIRRLWSPADCPAELLGYLASALSVDLWYDDWPEPLKRHVCARALIDQGQKGTLACVETYLGYVGAKVIKTVLPPGKAYYGRRRTKEELDARYSGLPEIRIYPFATAEAVPDKAFYSRILRGKFAFRSKAAARHQGRVTLVKDGEETPLKIEEIQSEGRAAEAVYVVGNSKPLKAFYGRILRGKFALVSDAASRVSIFARGESTIVRTAPFAGGPVDVTPERVMGAHAVAPTKAFYGRILKGRYAKMSVAAAHVYDRLRIWNVSYAEVQATRTYRGGIPTGRPTHTAILSIDLPLKKQPSKAYFGRILRGKFATPHDPEPLRRAFAAIRAASAFHDTILVDLREARDRAFFGS